MAIKFDLVRAGDVLYDVHCYRVGNTTLRRKGCWEVRVLSVDHESGTAVVSWNGNPDETWRRHAIERLRRKPLESSDA